MSSTSMSLCKKFTPNIFNKIKCSNCFRQKEEHSAEALECNRACRSVARSGYLFVAPDWDFSVPLNRTKRWQRRWFVLYDDGELNYSVDEHPDTVPQGSVDMSQVLEVTGAEQVTGHPHSLALTSPDRVTFVKAASREDARWWAELLAVFPRRHKRNATFPGGRASPSLPQLGRSASPQPPRLRHLSCTGASPRTNFTTPPLKEEKEASSKDEFTSTPVETTVPLQITQINNQRNDYCITSGSPPTRDKLRCEDKARVRRDWRNERLRDIATALTDRSPESSLALPAEGILNLKKGWLWYKEPNGEEWNRLWWVLCGPTLNAFKKEQDEQGQPEVSVELSTVTGCVEIQTETRYGFQINWSGPPLVLSAVTSGIRSNWLQALKRASPNSENSAPATPRSTILSSDDEYRTASEGGRRDSEDWGDYHSRSLLNVIRDKNLLRPKLSRCHSRQSTTDSVSTDELDGFKDEMTYNQVDDLKKKLNSAKNDIQKCEMEIFRMKKINLETSEREHKLKELLKSMEKTEKELILQVRQSEEKYLWEFKNLKQMLTDFESNNRKMEEQCVNLTREVQAKHRVISSLQDEINCTNERLNQMRSENDKLFKKLQDYEGKKRMMTSLTDLTNVDLDVDLESLNQNELMEQCLDLKGRFEKAVLEIRALKRELKESNIKYDKIELENIQLKRNIKIIETSSEDSAILMATRIEDLTSKLTTAEKQARTLKSKLQDSREKRRSLSLKGRENLSINKEVEDKLVELESKVLSIEMSRARRKPKKESSVEEKSLRRIRRKSLDSATSSEPIKLIMRLSTLENKITQVNTSEESLYNNSLQDLTKTDDFNVKNILQLAKEKIGECKSTLVQIRNKRRASSPSLDRLGILEANLNDLNGILSFNFKQFSQPEVNVVNSSVQSVVIQLKNLLQEKLKNIQDKKTLLRKNKMLNESAKIELFAEKIAFESIIIGRMNAAINLPENESCDRLISKESIETANLIKTLESKLLDSTKKDVQLITSVDYLTKILTQRLLNLGNNLNYPPKNPINYSPHIIIQLKDEQNKINKLVLKFKSEKLSVLAELLAIETLKLSNDNSCCITKDCIDKTWSKAREVINSELIFSEINHVLMKTAQKYESESCSDHKMFFTFYAFERAFLELWSESVESFLKSEMETYINELNELYENYLVQLKNHNLNSDTNKCKDLLEEFADVISHKALIDARVFVLKGECIGDSNVKNKSDTSFIRECYGLEEYWDCLQNINLVDKDRSAEEEFKLLLERNLQDAYGEVFYKMDFPNLCQAILSINEQIYDLQNIFGEHTGITNNDIIDIKDICFKCLEMQNVLLDLRESILSLKKRSHLLDEDHKRPLYFGTEYSIQVENLRAAFRKAISECENHKLQVDLEKLQNLCEQVLVSIEHWHRRALHDLRDTHSRELQALKDDKEQALAEETQATLAALDAMRKAHEAEVQREVARFKQDFIRKKENELTELQERLSVKCLEATALQEQLNSATRQLANAQLHISKLEHSSTISTYRN